MKRLAIAAAVLLLVYLFLRELAWRSDFMSALANARHGHLWPALSGALFFTLRGLLILIGPSLLALFAVRHLWPRASK